VGRLQRAFKGLGEVVKTAAGVVTGLFAFEALNKLRESIAGSIQAFSDFEAATAKVIAATGLTGEEADRLRVELQSLAKTAGVEFGTGATKAMEALEALVKAGMEGEDAAKALTSVLQMATIEGINTAEAADLLVGVLNQFGYAAEDAAYVTDVLVNASMRGIDTASDFGLALSYCGSFASQLGFTLEETTAALVAMNNQGIAAEKAGRYLQSMLQDLINNADKLGFSIYETTDATREWEAKVKDAQMSVDEANEKYEEMSDELERRQAEYEETSKAIKGMQDQFDDLDIEQAELRLQLEKLRDAYKDGAISEEEYKKQSEELEGQLRDLRIREDELRLAITKAKKEAEDKKEEINALKSSMEDQQAVVKQVEARLEALRAEYAKTTGKMLPLSEIITLLQQKLSEFSSEEERNAYLTSVFGQQSLRAVTTLTSLGDSTVTAGEKLKVLATLMGESGTAAQITEQQLSTFQGTMSKMQASLENAGITLGSAFTPLLSAAADAVSGMAGPIAETLTPAVKTLAEWLLKLGEFFGKIWETVSNALMPLWQELCRVADELAQEIFGVTDAADQDKNLIAALADVFVKVLKPVLAGIIGIILMVRDVIRAWNDDWGGIRTTITGFAAFLKATFDFIMDVFNGAIQFIKLLMEGDFAGALDFAKNCFRDFGEKLKPLANALLSWLSEAFNGFLTWLGEVWSNAWQACLDFLASLPERFIEAIGNVLNGIKDALLGFFNWLIGGSFWPDMWNSALNVLTNIGGSIVNAVGGFLKNIMSGITNFGSRLLEGWGKIWNSVKNVAGNVMNSVGNAISRFVSGAKNAAKGVGKAFGDVGKKISEAIGGFASSFKGIEKFIPHFQHGGVVTRPTLALLGERGPEAVIPLREIHVTPFGSQIVFNAPLIQVDGAVDRRTAEYVVREVEKALRNVIVEASSSGAPEAHRRIRFGSRVTV